MQNVSMAAWKRGMTQIKYKGSVTAVTLLEIQPHQIFRLKTREKDGYNAICFSAGHERKKWLAQPMKRQFEIKAQVPREEIFEVRLHSDAGSFSIEETEVNVDFLPSLVGFYVDIQGVSRGKGFAGVMKRWNFRGLEATHGVSITHRSHGSTGQRQDPGKVFKGKKMAGHLGNETSTVQNLEVVLYDKELNIVAVKGAVPGGKNRVVYIKSAVKVAGNSVYRSLNGLNIIYS